MAESSDNFLGLSDTAFRLASIFHPEALRRRKAALQHKTRFVHYTNASAAASIITGRSIWMRSAAAMNDYSEIRYGIQNVINHFGRTSSITTAKRFWRLLASIDKSLPDKITSHYDSTSNGLQADTYITSLSEHLPAEDHHGRLSMWRAYGGTQGVAIVINSSPLHGTSSALETYSHPVVYFDDSRLVRHFSKIVNNAEREMDFLKSLPPDDLEWNIITMLETNSICLKHPGFKEELEWRIAHRPKNRPDPRMVPFKTEIKGIPQLVYPLPLRDVPEEGLVGLSPNELVNRIIIGPTQYGMPMWDYFVKILSEVGCENAHEKVVLSNIPLRT